jgi:hypothetical protein
VSDSSPTTTQAHGNSPSHSPSTHTNLGVGNQPGHRPVGTTTSGTNTAPVSTQSNGNPGRHLGVLAHHLLPPPVLPSSNPSLHNKKGA